jgi:glycerophosphoryl diester phosphodiesterase
MPEQTLEAYATAIELGADGVETDVQLTGDGHLAMLHDLTVDRTTDGHGPIADMAWSAVRELDAGTWFGAQFAGLRVPSLEETIDLVVGAGRLLCVEIKGDPVHAEATATAVARHLRQRRLLDRVFISSFDHAALEAARREAGGALLAPERLPASGPPDPLGTVAQARALGAAVIQHRWEHLTAEVVDAVHGAGIGVWSWPIDTAESIAASVEAGVDAVIGDDVPLLLEGLGRKPPTAQAAARP